MLMKFLLNDPIDFELEYYYRDKNSINTHHIKKEEYYPNDILAQQIIVMRDTLDKIKRENQELFKELKGLSSVNASRIT